MSNGSPLSTGLDEPSIRCLARALAEELADLRIPQWLSSAKAARIADVTQKTVRRWVNRGDLRAYYAGPDLRIRLDDLIAYLSRLVPDDVSDIEARVRSLIHDGLE